MNIRKPFKQQSYSCPGCGIRIPSDKHLESESFVCHACLNPLKWKADGYKSRWIMAMFESDYD